MNRRDFLETSTATSFALMSMPIELIEKLKKQEPRNEKRRCKP